MPATGSRIEVGHFATGFRNGGRASSTPVRLALGLVLVFALASLATLGLAYLYIRSSLEDALNSNIAQNIAGFQAAPNAAALAALVQAEAAATNVGERIFSFTAADGRAFGNAGAVPVPGGIELLPIEGGKPLNENGYLHQVIPLYGGVLVVAESREPITNLAGIFATLLGLSLLPTTLVALGAGLAMSRRAARRVARIEAALADLTAGRLSARVTGITSGADDLGRIGASINRMAAAQESTVSVLRQVSTDIAHDLKTPVQRIAVLLAQLQDRIGPDSEVASLAERAGAEAARAVAVFQSLLTIAQIEGGSPRARFGLVDLAGLAATFVEIYEPSADESGHRLSLINAVAGPAQVTGDRNLLGQVIANLIENALRHTPVGTQIEVRLAQTGNRLRLVVADTGPGIPPDEHAKVLRRLYRLERSRTTPGNGLGLSLVAAICDLHGAKLVLSDENPGLSVSIDFPSVTARPGPDGEFGEKSDHGGGDG